jgi:hypothetical protein
MSLRPSSPVLVIAILVGQAGHPAAAKEPPAAPLAEKFLIEGKLSDGEKALAAHLEKTPADAQARFGLGTIQFARAVEQLHQGLYRYGLGANVEGAVGGAVPFLRLPMEKNPKPEPVSAAKLDKVFRQFLDDLGKARDTLEKVPDGDVKLPLHLFQVRLDLNGDGRADEGEGIAAVLKRMFNQLLPPELARAETVVQFDSADVHWLRGYCHLLAAMTEVILAYDWTEVVQNCGHIFFAKVEGAQPFLIEGKKVFDLGGVDAADAIALFHLLRLPVRDKAGMTRALEHFEKMIEQSRAMWKLVLEETDDDNEWIPGPKQKSALTGLRVTKEMVDDWKVFLDEADALLKGKKLVPFWRGNQDMGVNLRRVFTEPRTLDLVLWIQGTAAVPYLEKGEYTQKETWDRLQRTFRGDFIGFAIWFN